MNILLISGSLRKESLNTKLLRSLESRLHPHDITWADIDLPLFNEDIESDELFPEVASQFKRDIAAADVIVIATPEYNRSMSGALKNALDWASRPYGDNSWSGKKIYVLSVSVGTIAGAIAFYQVKQSLLHMGAVVPAKPEFMVGSAGTKFDDMGELVDEKTAEYLDALALQVTG